MNIKIILMNVVFIISCFAGEVEVIKDVVYGKGSNEDLKLDIVRPKDRTGKPAPAIVFMHGGGWEGGDKKNGIPYLTRMAKKGYFGVTIYYRLAPGARFPAQIEDCKCAVRFLRAKAKEYNIDPEHIASWGGSAGGHLAALLGTAGEVKEFEGTGGWGEYSSKVQAVIDYCGPADIYKLKNQNNVGNMLNNLFGGSSPKYKDAMDNASPVKHVSKDAPPFLIVHGEKDPVVTIKQSQAFAGALSSAGVEVVYVPVKNGVHGDFGDDYNEEKTVGEFLDKYLKK